MKVIDLKKLILLNIFKRIAYFYNVMLSEARTYLIIIIVNSNSDKLDS